MIQRLYVHNFRCLENFELRLADCSSAILLGRNGAGKSTVRLVLEKLQTVARGTNRVKQLPLDVSDFTGGAEGRRLSVPMRFEIEVMLGGKNYHYTLALELPDGFHELRIAEESLLVDGKPEFTRDRAQVVVGSGTRPARFQVDWHLAALPVIHVKSNRDPLNVIRTWLAHMLILSPIPALIDGESTESSLFPNLWLTNLGEWISGLVQQYPKAYTEIDEYLRKVLADFDQIQNVVTGPDARSLSIRFGRDELSATRAMKELSDGEKGFIICAVVLAAKTAYGPLFCFWDEPDNYVSLSEVGDFLLALRKAFQKGSQLLATSHNPEAIRQFSDENSFWLAKRSQFEPTQIFTISDLRKSGEIHGDLVGALIRNDIP